MKNKAKKAKEIKHTMETQQDTKSFYFSAWFDDNMIYCADTHSFVHRMFDDSKNWKTYNDAQNAAFRILKEMRKEFDEWIQKEAE